jgi:CheY-like chemotaxis protein
MLEAFLQNNMSNSILDECADSGITITHFPAVLGRHPDCDHCIDHPMVSRRHCVFYVQDNQVWVQDLESRNGTCVNGASVAQAKALQDGDALNIAGLSFTVRLPVELTAAAVKPGAAASTQAPAAQPRQVLIVEDNDAAAESLALLIKNWGHKVQVARDGPEAIALARECQPDTVLLDIRLPGMDGYEVAHHLQDELGPEKAKVVAMTGYDPEDEGARVQEAGISRLVTKPLDPDVLLEVLDQPK